MSLKQVHYAEKRLCKLWRAMVLASERGASALELERLYDAYALALQSYLRCCEAYYREVAGIDIHRCA
ncbi:hypothetical protein [Thermogemmatispora sp.]|uniref:hypothetical protein n=1 Tax=Thermogemmatispora sp. TaxID=1968838 RepID=UPI001DAEEE14|nr:hypothetical protein [Thermogemmatispora sp.]MBX5449785.1 hypothetical protein [Thermogemmatispora sp.]